MQDLEWYYWQRCADLGLEVAFKPFFTLVRSEAMRTQYGAEDQVIRHGESHQRAIGLALPLRAKHCIRLALDKPSDPQVKPGLRPAVRFSAASALTPDVLSGLYGRQVTESEGRIRKLNSRGKSICTSTMKAASLAIACAFGRHVGR